MAFYFLVMSITLDLPEEITSNLLQRAQSAGQTPAAFVADALRRQFAADELLEKQQLEDIEWALSQDKTPTDKGEDRCVDGSLWPQTPAEIEAWCAEVKSLPRLFDDEAEARAFEDRLAAVRLERSAGLAVHRDRVAGLFAA